MSTKPTTAEELSIIDLILLIAEYWWIILMASLVAAGATFYLSFTSIEEYYSTTKTREPAPQIDSWLQSHPQFAQHRSGFTVSSDPTEGTTVTFRAETPEMVRETLSSFIDTTSSELLAEQRQSLHASLIRLKSRIHDLDALASEALEYSHRVQKEPHLDGKAVASFLELLHSLRTERFHAQLESQRIEDEFSRLQNVSIFAPASIPTKIEGSNPYALSVLAALGTGVGLLLLAFIREGIRRATTDPDNAAKLQYARSRIRRPRG